MSDLFFKIYVIVLLAFTYYNATEAHRHTHELACYVQAADLCEFHGHEGRIGHE
jgi:hypothetical protein